MPATALRSCDTLNVRVTPSLSFSTIWMRLLFLSKLPALTVVATKVFGNVNVGLIVGLLQFVSTFVITWLYVRYANRKLDPGADKIRAEIEGES